MYFWLILFTRFNPISSTINATDQPHCATTDNTKQKVKIRLKVALYSRILQAMLSIQALLAVISASLSSLERDDYHIQLLDPLNIKH